MKKYVFFFLFLILGWCRGAILLIRLVVFCCAALSGCGLEWVVFLCQKDFLFCRYSAALCVHC